jgi:hypothetical protein
VKKVEGWPARVVGISGIKGLVVAVDVVVNKSVRCM